MGLVLCVVLWLVFPAGAQGENRLKDLHVEEQGERTRLAFFMDRLPSLLINDVVQPGRVSIGLPGASANLREETRTSASMGRVSLVRTDGASGVTVSVPFESGFREAAAGWLKEKSVLVVDLFPHEGGSSIQGPEGARDMRKLKGVRSGPRKNCIRVVLDLDSRPTFKVSWKEPSVMVLSLSRTETAFKLERVGTLKRLKGASLTREGDTLSLRLQCDYAPAAWRVFWLNEGNRLVVDLFESTHETPFESVALPTGPVNERIEKAEPFEPMPPLQAAAEVPAQPPPLPDRPSAWPAEDLKEAPPPQPIHPPRRTASGDRFVRMPISRGERPMIKASGAEEPSSATLNGSPQEGHEPAHGLVGDTVGSRRSDRALMEGLEPEEAMLYGRVLEAMNFKDFKRGMELVSEFLKKFPASTLTEQMVFTRADFLFHLVESGRTEMLQEMGGRYREAIGRFERSARVPQAYLRMAQSSAATGQDFPALGYLNTLLARFPENPLKTEALLERGKAYLRSGSPEKGLQDFKTILKESPQSPHSDEARYGIATYFYRRGMYAETLTWLKEIEKRHPVYVERHPEYLSMRGQTHLYVGEHAQARDWFYRALNLGAQPETPDLILAHIGDAYFQDGQEKEAEALYRLVTETFEGTEGAAIARLRLADFPQSDEPLKDLAEKNQATPVGELAVLKMAEVYYRRGENAETMEALKDLVSGPAENQVQRAALHLFLDSAEKQMTQMYEENRWDLLIELFRKHEKILYGKIRPESQFLISQALLKLRMYDAAISSLNQMAPEDLGPDLRYRYFMELANACRMTGDPDRAKEVLETGIKGEHPPEGKQRLEKLLADVLRQTGNDQAAYGVYEKLIRAESALPERETAEALLSMGEIQNGEGRYAKGRGWLEKAAGLTEANPACADLHASVLAATGDGHSGEGRPKEAVRFYDKALKAGFGPEKPGYWKIKFRMAEAHLALDDRTLARQIFREIQEEGEADLQSRVQLRLGTMDLEDQLMRLSVWAKPSGTGHAKQ